MSKKSYKIETTYEWYDWYLFFSAKDEDGNHYLFDAYDEDKDKGRLYLGVMVSDEEYKAFENGRTDARETFLKAGQRGYYYTDDCKYLTPFEGTVINKMLPDEGYYWMGENVHKIGAPTPLVNRFASDCGFPIPITFKEDYFFYYIRALSQYGGRLLSPKICFDAVYEYRELCRTIVQDFDSNPDKFLEHYAMVRDRMIQDTLSNPAYGRFNQMDLSRFAVVDRPQASKNGVYNEERIGGLYVSVDLSKANFQALKYVDPAIVMGAETYEDFVEKFTDLAYVKKSKYTRQVVFGKLNASRQITVEKYLINEVRKVIDNDGLLELVSMGNDELIYKVTDEDVVLANIRRFNTKSRLASMVKEKLNLDVRVDVFKLHGYQLCFKESEHPRFTFYDRETMFSTKPNCGNHELKCVPLPYFMTVFKLFNGLGLDELDRHFSYEGMDVIMNEEFILKQLG